MAEENKEKSPEKHINVKLLNTEYKDKKKIAHFQKKIHTRE